MRSNRSGKGQYLQRRGKIIPTRAKAASGQARGHKSMHIQNAFRRKFDQMARKMDLAPVREIGSGVDYIHWYYKGKEKKTFKLDFKFSFGDLGPNTIKIRVSKDTRRLLNNSDWVVAMDASSNMVIFPTQKMADYVSRCYGSLVQSARKDKGTYLEYPLMLKDLFEKTATEPLVLKLSEPNIKYALRWIREQIEKKEPPIKNREPIVSIKKNPNGIQNGNGQNGSNFFPLKTAKKPSGTKVPTRVMDKRRELIRKSGNGRGH
jgi:hypothetical protein